MYGKLHPLYERKYDNDADYNNVPSLMDRYGKKCRNYRKYSIKNNFRFSRQKSIIGNQPQTLNNALIDMHSTMHCCIFQNMKPSKKCKSHHHHLFIDKI